MEELASKIKQKEAKTKEYKEKKRLLDEAKYKEVMNYIHIMGNEQNIGHAEGLAADMRISRELAQALIDEYYNSVNGDLKTVIGEKEKL